jgi:hypothetical protein
LVSKDIVKGQGYRSLERQQFPLQTGSTDNLRRALQVRHFEAV